MMSRSARGKSDRDLQRWAARSEEGKIPNLYPAVIRLRYSIIKEREGGSDGLGGRSTQRECGGKKKNCGRDDGLRRSRRNGLLNRCALDYW